MGSVLLSDRRQYHAVQRFRKSFRSSQNDAGFLMILRPRHCITPCRGAETAAEMCLWPLCRATGAGRPLLRPGQRMNVPAVIPYSAIGAAYRAVFLFELRIAAGGAPHRTFCREPQDSPLGQHFAGTLSSFATASRTDFIDGAHADLDW